MAYLELLKRVDAFCALSDDELSVIDGFCTRKKFIHGMRLFKDGDAADHLWVVENGLIDLRFDLPDSETSEESTLSSVSENNIIGWSSLVTPNLFQHCYKKDLKPGEEFFSRPDLFLAASKLL